MSILSDLNSPSEIKRLKNEELEALAAEIREKLLATVLKNGGHLASNLGVVELSLALHSVFSSPDDRIIWDVGHQSYVHKLLTGRYKDFDSLRSYGGLSGFQRRSESVHDSFGAGHSSTSISAAVGLASADKLAGRQNTTVAVIGDGAFTGGMAYEALNNIADKKIRLVIVLNDNEMSIGQNVGGMSKYLSNFRTSPRYFKFKHGLKKFFSAIPLLGKGLIAVSRKTKNIFRRLVLKDNLFESLGLNYLGPIDGYDIKRLKSVLEEAKAEKISTIVHVRTVKGKGYEPAEKNPEKYHGVSKGFLDKEEAHAEDSFSSKFGEIVTARAGEDKKLCAVSAAMGVGTGLSEFSKRFKERFFDVGIAEEHGMTFCAALSAGGMHPVFALYSTFAQRCYDQMLHDAAIQRLPVVLAFDRAGLVGEDGATHHGVFDVSFLQQIPGMTIYSPETYEEMKIAFSKAFEFNALCAVRYPRGKETFYDRSGFSESGTIFYKDFGEGEPQAVIVTYGRITKNACEAAELLKGQGMTVRIIKVFRLKPLDGESFINMLNGSANVYFLEEGIKSGGFSERAATLLAEKGLLGGRRVVINAIDDRFVTHGATERLFEDCGFLPEQIAADIKRKF